MLKKIPVPACGLALGLASLGNLLAPFGTVVRYSCGAAACLIALLFTMRLLTDFGSVRRDLENPVAFSVLPTYTMALMLLSAYAKPFIGTAAVAVWFAAVTSQLVIMAAFIKIFVLRFNIRQVFPSWFVMFVGIVVASVTSPVMGQKEIGRLLFFVGFASYMALLPIVMYRVLKIGGIPEPARPTIAIFCAPASLCFVGYMSAFDEKNAVFALFIAALSLTFWLAVIASMPGMLKLPFFPSYSALTFPLVISATAFGVAGPFFGGSAGNLFSMLSPLATMLAAAAVLYILTRYVMFWFAQASPAEQAVPAKK